MKAICYRFFHSPGVGVFFLLYGVVSCLSLISGFSSPGELFVQNLGDMGPPVWGCPCFQRYAWGRHLAGALSKAKLPMERPG